ncbi:MAG: preprotein translocase subunit YajC [bacterium]
MSRLADALWSVPAAYAGARGGSGDEPSFIIQLVPFFAVFAIIYFIMIRPQQKRQQETRAMLSALRVGDSVIASGIFGEITKIKDDILHIKVADNVRIRVLRSAVSGRPAAAEAESGGSPDKSQTKA